MGNMIYLDSAKFINCQSHEDTTMHFSPGLNVIIADNNVGKSVFMKMLKIAGCPTFYSNEEREQLIRKGCEFASVIYTFSDGSASAVRVYPKAVTYYYTDDYKNQGFLASYEPDERMIQKLSLIVDQEEAFIANILDLDQSLFLVNSSTKSNHNMVKLLTNDKRLNRMIDLIKGKEKFYKERLARLDEIHVELNHKISTYQYVDTDSLGQRIETCEAALHLFEGMINAYREFENVQGMVDMRDFDSLINLCTFVDEAQTALDACTEFFTDEFDGRIIHYMDIYISLNEAFAQANVIVHDMDNSIYIGIELLTSAFEEASAIEVPELVDETLIVMLDTYEDLSIVDFNLKMLYNNLSIIEKTEEEIQVIHTQLNEVARRVPCVIYGEVQHLNGECIPIDNRSA